MTSPRQHQSSKTTKMLLLGDSGAGKTGALACLVGAGYKLRILDLDNGADIIAGYFNSPLDKEDKLNPYYIKDEDIQDKIDIVTITNKMKTVAGKPIPASANAWQRALDFCGDWKARLPDNPALTLGNVSTWKEDEILVIDSLSFLSKRAMEFIAAANGRSGQQPWQNDYGAAQMMIEGLLQLLYDDSVKCQVIVTCHLMRIEDQSTGVTRLYPEGPGKALSPKIGRYFNNTLLVQTVGTKHKILTQSTPLVELKTSAPLKVKNEYPIENGLALFLKDLRG